MIIYHLKMELEPTSQMYFVFQTRLKTVSQHSFILIEMAEFFPTCLVGERHIG
jgi:hypothetical protein